MSGQELYYLNKLYPLQDNILLKLKGKEKSLDDRYQPRQPESFDALAMRFSRTSDILTQKVLRDIFLDAKVV